MTQCACGCGKETPVSHYNRTSRGYKIGDHQKYILGHDRHTGKINKDNGYLYDRGVSVHRKTVERIIGRKLPDHSIIHHINGIRDDNRPENLVVCDSPSYHALIHQRERALRECGNADWKMCSICKKWDSRENLSAETKSRRSVRHKECHRLAEIKRRMIKRGGN